jgi:anti-sigma B factor antagonist
MAIHLEVGSGVTVLRPPGEFNIYVAVEFRDVLLKALATGNDLEVDLAAVTEMDAAGLQQLLVAQREASAGGKKMRITGAGPAVLEVMELCNVATRFEGVPVVPPQHWEAE